MSTAADTTVPKLVAAIDIGSNSFRMVIAQVHGSGRIEVLERLQRAVRLGQDTFRRGRLGGQSMGAALAVLKDFGQVLKLYAVEQVRAVATSAVREASNADMFLDRIYLATRLKVEVIDTSEESRLTVSAVREALKPAMEHDHKRTLLVDVGGGSTLLTLLEGADIITSLSLRLGSIRLQEMLSISDEPPHRSAEILRAHVDGVLRASRGSLNLEEVEAFVAVGGDARFAAKQVGHPTASADLMAVEAPEFDRLVERCQHYTSEELSRRYGMPFAEAETLNPALVIYQELLHRTQVPRMLVSQASMRDGLLLDLASRVTGKEDETLLVGISRAALALAEKYRADLNHAQLVAEVAVRLFDALLPDHGLASRHRLLLHVAALLHEIGGFVSNRSHHKHSEYLIANSEIFGLSRAETAVVAQIARYHRRSMPRATHPGYMVLPREDRVVVNKLAALLRVADALARNPTGQTRHARIERHGEELLITVPGVKDLILERHAVAAKGDLFEEVYGMRVRLEEV